MKIQNQFVLTAAILLLLLFGCSPEADAEVTDAPILAGGQPSAPPPLSPEASFFYDSLAPYGQWLWDAPNGWVWTPNNVMPGWRPYTDGSWAYSDAGWTWMSDASWGWAPYHYGRWFFHEQRGWCWVPGREWAPAWVAWHWGDNYCGWAPLPPGVDWQTYSDWDAAIPVFGWCFVEHRDFYERHLNEHVALVARNITLLGVTRNVTRFEARGGAVVNLSLSVEQVERATGRPARRYSITEVHSPGEVRGSLKVGTAINIYRPMVRETRMITPLPHQGMEPRPPVTFEQLRRNEAAQRNLEAQHARERAALEKVHDAELRAPPPGVTAPQLQERHQAEHREMNEHVNRQKRVIENRH